MSTLEKLSKLNNYDVHSGIYKSTETQTENTQKHLVHTEEINFDDLIPTKEENLQMGLEVMKINGKKKAQNEKIREARENLPEPSEVIPFALLVAKSIADEDEHGYSQRNRNGNPDYDCSSFVCTAMEVAGVPVSSIGGASYTGNMRKAFEDLGFEWHEGYPTESELQPGDVLFYRSGSHGHTELYAGNGQTYGAHDNFDGEPGDGDGREINCQPWTDCSVGDKWQGYLRYVGKKKYSESA